MGGSRGITILDMESREDSLSGERAEGRDRGSEKWMSGGTVFQVEGTASTKAMRQGHTWYDHGTKRKPLQLEQRE